MNSLYLSDPVVACFDGEDADGAAGVPVPDPTPDPSSSSGRTFSQQELNNYLARERAKDTARLQRAEDALRQTAESANLSAREKEQLQQQIEEVQAQSRTKEQQLAHERQQAAKENEKKIAALQKEAKEWQDRHHTELTERELNAAAVKHDAHNPRLVASFLRQHASVREVTDEKGNSTGRWEAVVNLPTTDEEGRPITLTISPDAAVKHLAERPGEYGGLFRSNIVSGIGGSSSAGGIPTGSGGKVDPRRLSQQQYMELREKNPEVLGLRPQKKPGYRR
jgi:hypothetical protein